MTELKTMLEVAQAKERGEVVEILQSGHRWEEWTGFTWQKCWQFRIQPKPVKMVKYCLFGNTKTGSVKFTAGFINQSDEWIRIPGTEVEVPE